jgi:hypothetical protein
MSVFLCPHCSVRSTFAWSYHNKSTRIGVALCHNCRAEPYITVDNGIVTILYPQAREEEPSQYPDDVRNNYAEAVRSLMVNNFKSCVIMIRSALQAATRQQGAKGSSLYAEIEDLANRHIVPTSLKDWAHELRDGGNLVAHPEPGKRVTKDDAEELLGLAESIFEYLYVVPAQVVERRQRVAGQHP